MTDYFELHEIDESDVQMRLFAQTLTGDVKKWCKGLPTTHIEDLDVFIDCLWIDRKQRKTLSKYYLNIITLEEILMDQFNSIYNAIPTNIKRPPNLRLIKFPDGFDTDMSYQ